MRLSNEISIDAPADDLFAFVSDVERVAPCLPGAHVDGSEGDNYRGSMRVKVGPITAEYRGTLRFIELDASARRAVLLARADETNGQGQAEARIVTVIEEQADASFIRMETDLQIRGRVAQFGRGAMEKIAQRLFAEFAHNLEAALTGDEQRPAPAEVGAPTRERRSASGGATTQAGGELDAVSLLKDPLVAKALGALVPAFVGFGYGYLLGKLRERAR